VRVRAFILLASVLGAVLSTGVASAVSPTSVIAQLNAQRSKNGIPAGIVENKGWSKACAAHIRYLKRTHEFAHTEQKGKPGYTKEGAWAGQHSVLSIGATWARGNLWEDAPIHLMQVLTPKLRSIGVDDSGGYTCATTYPGYRLAAKNAVYTYPGNGTSGWRTAETAREIPYTPGEAVGLRQGTRTGQIILVLGDGPWARSLKLKIIAATLTGPAGPAKIRTVDNYAPKVGPYMPPGGVIIPLQPLAPNATYKASVTLKGGAATLTRAWSFKTAG
jgi:Cysteine-rich secretory protein family